jgi:ribosome-associated heat shock protein Hsp15
MLAAVSFSAADKRDRLDQWLWTVRVFKTRALATAACRTGAVTVNGLAAKPARAVRAGDTVAVRLGVMTRTLRVLAVPAARLGAKLVAAHAGELTPESEFAKARAQRVQRLLARERGGGRPTKRDRRQFERLWE